MKLTRADLTLVLQQYETVVQQLDVATRSFMEAAENDPPRQTDLQIRLMTAIIAFYLQSMPELTEATAHRIMEYALQVARAHPLEEEAPPIPEDKRDLN